MKTGSTVKQTTIWVAKSASAERLEMPVDKGSYEPSHDHDGHVVDDNQYEPVEETTLGTDVTVNALDHVSAEHPFMPASRRHLFASSHVDFKSRVKCHPEFWWDVILVMQEKINPNQSGIPGSEFRSEVTRLQRHVRRLREKREAERYERKALRHELIRLLETEKRLEQEKEKAEAVIWYLESDRLQSNAAAESHEREHPSGTRPQRLTTTPLSTVGSLGDNRKR
ncbi:hypothetical protein O9K51_11014 [Purpureocillium lavendulum]|uniref:Uncharacterized protein n=1 Tax=Purpureocillium lavendulum TaxID=1247861 RepID=A0AB34FC28_9HYPO|nr:hypothetical protein O9K51_11014 [Purpureocillium lavendulum]